MPSHFFLKSQQEVLPTQEAISLRQCQTKKTIRNLFQETKTNLKWLNHSMNGVSSAPYLSYLSIYGVG